MPGAARSSASSMVKCSSPSGPVTGRPPRSPLPHGCCAGCTTRPPACRSRVARRRCATTTSPTRPPRPPRTCPRLRPLVVAARRRHRPPPRPSAGPPAYLPRRLRVRGRGPPGLRRAHRRPGRGRARHARPRRTRHQVSPPPRPTTPGTRAGPPRPRSQGSEEPGGAGRRRWRSPPRHRLRAMAAQHSRNEASAAGSSQARPVTDTPVAAPRSVGWRPSPSPDAVGRGRSAVAVQQAAVPQGPFGRGPQRDPGQADAGHVPARPLPPRARGQADLISDAWRGAPGDGCRG